MTEGPHLPRVGLGGFSANTLTGMAEVPPLEPGAPSARSVFLTPEQYRRRQRKRRVRHFANLLRSGYRYLRLSREQRRVLRSHLRH
jgi:hypothetical protein